MGTLRYHPTGSTHAWPIDYVGVKTQGREAKILLNGAENPPTHCTSRASVRVSHRYVPTKVRCMHACIVSELNELTLIDATMISAVVQCHRTDNYRLDEAGCDSIIVFHMQPFQ